MPHADDPRSTADRRRRPTRREMLAFGAGAFVVAAIPLSLRRRERLVRRQMPVMGTIADLAVLHTDERAAHAALDAAVAALVAVDGAMSRFANTSDVGRANLRAGREPVVVGAETARVLEEALAWAETSDGAFDPCLGSAASLWDVTHRTAPPTEADARRFAGKRLHRQLELATRLDGTQVVRIASGEASIDLGGIAKGHGVDLAVAALREHGITQGLVNVGGDLYALGASEDGDAWRVGIRSPDDPAGLAGTLEIRDRAVATSGDYERCFRHDGRRYHHLLDPATGGPRVAALRSVTVLADTCLAADAAATTAFALPRDAAERVMRTRAPHAQIASLLPAQA